LGNGIIEIEGAIPQANNAQGAYEVPLCYWLKYWAVFSRIFAVLALVLHEIGL
jgi:hypothetical protein